MQDVPFNMQAEEVYNLLRVPDKTDKESILRQAWSLTHTSCKDVVALACPLKPLPTSLEAFKKMISENSKQQDFVMASFYVIYVGLCDGQQYGWSKAPYDAKNKKREEQKPLYTLDTNDVVYNENAAPVFEKAQTRFWSFKKVSNNMNKGPRIEKLDDKDDLSFVLKGGISFSIFLREENFEEQKSIFAGTWESENDQGVLATYKPILLQLSGANEDQALKGNGFKVRSFAPAPRELIIDFYDCFFDSTSELLSWQTETAQHISLKTITKANKSSPIVGKIDPNAFVYREAGSQLLEIVNSGCSNGKKLLMDEQVLLEATNSEDVDRALRMLSVAIGHNAVKCLIAPQEYTHGMTSDAMIVVHLKVDLAEAMWFNMLHKCKAAISTQDSLKSLPKTSMLTMCFGKSISENTQEGPFLQWYSPKTMVTVADVNGQEFLCNVVFEMMLITKQMAGQRDVSNKLLFMDEVSGFHYVIKVFNAHKVTYSDEDGLMCTNPTLLVTWQFRPGSNTSQRVTGSGRKRVQMLADSLDLINSGECVSEYAKINIFQEENNEETQPSKISKLGNASQK
jgi:hypothetical protein